jgi:AAA15 family ATPase/GTPase
MSNTNVATFLEKTLENLKEKKLRLFDAEKEDPEFFSDITTNINNSNVLIIYGENASGKSLFSNVIEQFASVDGFEIRHSCMRNRTVAGIGRALIYGEEAVQSTGATSVLVSKNAIESTVNSEEKAIAILDEPDIGLSDYYSPALGKYIAEKCTEFDQTKGLVLVSHSKKLISSFLNKFDKPVNTLGINTKLELSEWLSVTKEASIEELLNLNVYARNKERAIMRAMKK